VTTADVFGKVAVLLGGRSAERGISLKSGAAVLAALQARGVDAHSLDSGQDDFFAALQAGAFDRAFIALHGRGGECGAMQGLLETLGLAYTGSGVLGSALAMDKLRSKQLWLGVGLPTPAFAVLRNASDIAGAGSSLGFPLMLKPVHEGSSIGMSRVAGAAQLLPAWQTACTYDRDVLAERWITGAEYTAAIVAGTSLPLIRLETPREFYDYEAKYQADSTRYHCPCGLPAATEAALQALALQAFSAVGASGWGRVDFMVDTDGQPWLIEVNTVPGMTDHSLVPMAAARHGWDMPELVWRILATSLETRS
jgi:D-alanine-D-alanine ligase